MKKGKNLAVIITVAIMLAAVIAMELLLVFRMTSEQTMESGRYRLESISGELENTINEAKNFTMQIGVTIQPVLDDRSKLSDLIYDIRSKLPSYENGAFNIYIAGSDWSILPGLENPENFDPNGRDWFTGAVRSGGAAFVTPPYIDVVTGNMCYTVSVLLADSDTVLSVDYSMDNIQSHVVKMTETGLHNAVIVTDDGIIAGCSDETLIGEPLSAAFPEYSAVFYLAKSSDDFVTHRIKSGVFYENLFATGTDLDWYLIVNESDWELYRNSYLQLFITLILTLALTAVIVFLYVKAARNRRKAESALRSKDEFISTITGELETPLKKILHKSDTRNYTDLDTAPERFTGIHEAGEQLSYKIQQIVSYSNIVKSEEKKKEVVHSEGHTLRINKRFRNIILSMLVLVMSITLISTIMLSRGIADAEMENAVNSYESQLSEWVNKQKNILDMITTVISTNPNMIDDQDEFIRYLDRIASRYPEISALYMANPKFKPSVLMNNGWQPDDNWRVEERQWYKDTLASADGWSISAPYFDEQTGYYCVTVSEKVLNGETGEFLGNFGIDFYMDKLIGILSDSYSENGYAFLTDASGTIINHPYGTFQMTDNHRMNVSELKCGELMPDGRSTIVYNDYDNYVRIFTAKRSELSNFVVYKANDIWQIYGRGFFIGIICLVTVSVCIIIVYRLLTLFIRWQDRINQRMKEAAETATAAGQAKSRFLAQMSHEIRTPINAVLGMNEMILNEATDKNILEYSENIRVAGKTLLSLINSILDFSKIEDGKMEVISTEYDTLSVINNLINSVQGRAQSKGLEFVTNIDDNIPKGLIGDDVRVTQVIMNLLTNAVKYTEKGTVTLDISVKEHDEKDVVLAVSVKDTGIGIREEDMGKLFESFSRLDETRNRNIEGTGLGMSIVTKLLQLMGSKLEVESIYGAGSTFSFEIKQGISDARPIGSTHERRKDASGIRSKERPLFPQASILVTDDNEMNLKVAKNLMKLFGIVPELASSGEEAIGKVRKKHYDVIFLDHMMPKMDGIETLERMKFEKILAEDTTVIALTANAVNGAKEMYLKSGFDDYLSKPIETEELEAKLRRYVKNASDKKDKTSNDTSGVIDFSPEENTILEFDPDEDTNTKPPRAAESDKEQLLKLFTIGISTSDGLSYCANDATFYLEMLNDFVNSADDRIKDIQTAYDAHDIKSYEITAHALKSISKTVGVNNVSKLAKDLEFAAKAEDEKFIKQHHREFIDLYRETVEKIRNIIAN